MAPVDDGSVKNDTASGISPDSKCDPGTLMGSLGLLLQFILALLAFTSLIGKNYY